MARVLRQSAGFAFFTAISRILGLLRDIAIAIVFGASGLTDAFLIAFRIPNVFRSLFAEGAFSQALVPLLIEYKTQHGVVAMEAFAAQVLLRLILVLSVLVVVIWFAAPVLALILAPGFSSDNAQFTTVITLLRLTFPYLLFISVAAFCAAWLNTWNRFAAPAVTPILLNLTLIAAAWGAWYFATGTIIYLGWGVLIAGILQCLFLFAFIVPLGFRPVLRWRRHPAIGRMLRLMFPTLISASATKLALLLDNILASFLAAGSVSWLYFSSRLIDLPAGMFGVAIGTVILPRLSRMNPELEAADYRRIIDWGLHSVLLIAIPSAAALFLLAEPIITTLFQHRAFTSENVLPTAQALRAYCIGLPFYMLARILTNAYFARFDARTPMHFAMVSILLNIILSVALIGVLAHVGLALGTVVGGVLNAILLYLTLCWRGWVVCDWRRWCVQLSRILGATVAMLWLLGHALDYIGSWNQFSLFGQMAYLSLLCFGGGAVYLGILWLGGLRRHHIDP